MGSMGVRWAVDLAAKIIRKGKQISQEFVIFAISAFCSRGTKADF